MKRVVILGSTGSIGRSALEVVRTYPEAFTVVGLSAGSNHRLLARQAKEFGVRDVGIGDARSASALRKALPGRRVWVAEESAEVLPALPKADIVLSAISGTEGLRPTWNAVKAGKDVALANKESLVLAGDLLTALARRNGVAITPVDSEHSAVWALLRHVPRERVERIVLTASGGPFFRKRASEFRRITVRQALRHPTWSMGAKITVDSATMLNKGFEVIEAHHLFGFSYDRIAVVIHPESIVHSFVQGVDGAYYGQLGPADMRLPILAALSAERPLASRFPAIHLPHVAKLTFHEPDLRKFPLLGLAYEVGKAGGILPAVMAAADDVAVRMFLEGRIAFTDIHRIIRRYVERWAGRRTGRVDLETVLGVCRSILAGEA